MHVETSQEETKNQKRASGEATGGIQRHNNDFRSLLNPPQKDQPRFQDLFSLLSLSTSARKVKEREIGND